MQATHVVRGLSSRFSSTAWATIARCAALIAETRKSTGFLSLLRASCWKRRVISVTAISAASSPFMCPPMPSAITSSSMLRLYE